jgi:hypothetical protein
MDSNTNNYDTTLSTNQNPLIPNFQNINYIQLQNQQDQNYNQTYNPQPQTNQQNILYQNNNQFSQNILQPKSEENIDENYENSQEKKEDTHKRRSKNDTEGRTFVCQLCGKSYLSYPALYTHRKQKHNTNLSSGRGRGRPKKDISEQNIERIKFNPCNFNYFQKENRKGETNEFKKVILDAFNFLYNIKDDYEKSERNKKRKMKEYNNINEHPLFNKFLNDPHNKNEKIDENENKITDDVFIDYLNKVSAYCNEDFFEKILIFVVLFREYVNQVYSNKVENGIEFTTQEKAEDVPDTSNEFILDFIDPDENNNDFGFSKDECIDLIQNLCHWMYEHNFTCSKLSMINMDSAK